MRAVVGGIALLNVEVLISCCVIGAVNQHCTNLVSPDLATTSQKQVNDQVRTERPDVARHYCCR